MPAEPAASPGARQARPGLSRPLVRASVLGTLVALVGGGAGAVAMDKTVTVTVDGQDRVLHTYAEDVAGTLAAAGIASSPQDQVTPALPTDVVDGDRIVVQHARMLTLVEGGAERAVWTTAGSVGEALAGLGLEASAMDARLTIYAEASARFSNSAYAARTSSPMRCWAAISAIGRRSAKLRRSLLTEY